jgi:hypothetical protein
MDSRFNVAARMLVGQERMNSSGAGRQTMKVACSRPFAEQKPASRADPESRLATSLVSCP